MFDRLSEDEYRTINRGDGNICGVVVPDEWNYGFFRDKYGIREQCWFPERKYKTVAAAVRFLSKMEKMGQPAILVFWHERYGQWVTTNLP